MIVTVLETLYIYCNFVIYSWTGPVPAGPTTTQHNCHHDMKVKPEVATVVIELLIMGGKTPETC